ncbi:hypothetical protein AZI85_16325 [Bdellovibrio bacteriovorus]|uniref:Uncharacterized protein n=1 Tax=Bdellovibrio bacteriovorus TaxID=959 RepID=A0A150WU43_BDEBC|nr:hypothetical protein [Bdellovibrio bacteriovorus]KYG69812.1 hypothetical protein AZI85_16325 [Bdellovibrio bacteriovorus]
MKTFVLFFIMMFSLAAMAGPLENRESNGGKGIVVGNKAYLLDLLERTPYDAYLPAKKPFVFGLKKEVVFRAFPASFPREKIYLKLLELNQFSPEVMMRLYNTARRLQWQLVEGPLALTADDTFLDGRWQGYQLVQLAERRVNVIRIDRAMWQRLDDVNKVALVIHEIVYSAIDPLSTEFRSDLTRFFVSSIFSKEDFPAMNYAHTRLFWQSVFFLNPVIRD